MIAIANNRTHHVQELQAIGITGRTVAHEPVMYPGEISMFEYACSLGNAEAAELLYETDFDLEKPNENDMTRLMCACSALELPDPRYSEEERQSSEVVAQAESMIRWRGAQM